MPDAAVLSIFRQFELQLVHIAQVLQPAATFPVIAVMRPGAQIERGLDCPQVEADVIFLIFVIRRPRLRVVLRRLLVVRVFRSGGPFDAAFLDFVYSLLDDLSGPQVPKFVVQLVRAIVWPARMYW